MPQVGGSLRGPVIVIAAAAASLGRAVAQERVSFRYILTNEVSLNEPDLLKYILKNQTAGMSSLDFGFDRIGSLTFELTSPARSVQRVTPDSPMAPTERSEVVRSRWPVRVAHPTRRT